MAGDVIWPRACFDKSPSQKARYGLLVDWHEAILAIVDQKGLKEQVSVLNEKRKFTVSLRKREAGEQARAAVVVAGTSEHVFSRELVTELMAGFTEMEVREMVSRQRTRPRTHGIRVPSHSDDQLATTQEGRRTCATASRRLTHGTVESCSCRKWVMWERPRSTNTSSGKGLETRPSACHHRSLHTS